MKKSPSIIAYLLVLCGLLFTACSENNEGTMPAWNSGDVYTGKGFYLDAVLDSGRRVHALHDTLLVRLDSLWTVSSCYLKTIQKIQNSHDSTLNLMFDLSLTSNPNIACPASPLGGDTIIKIAPESGWANLSLFRVFGAVDSLMVDTSTTIPFSSNFNDSLHRFGAVKDSIWIIDGKNRDSVFSFTLDSLFWKPHLLPRVTGSGPYVVRVVRSATPVNDVWRMYTKTCTKVRDNCATEPDTTDYYTVLGDTGSASLRTRCINDSTHLQLCAAANWVTDTTVAVTYRTKPDTNWIMSSFYVESIPHCSVLNRDTVKYFSLYSTGGSLIFKRELFVPSASVARCGIPWVVSDSLTTKTVEFGGTSLDHWLVYNLDSRVIVTDPALADSVIIGAGFIP